MPELSSPTRNTGFQCCRNCGTSPRRCSRGHRNSEATTTRMAAVGSVPHSTTARRMNRNDDPQMAASSTKSFSQRWGEDVAGCMRAIGVEMVGAGQSQGAVVCPEFPQPTGAGATDAGHHRLPE